MITEDDGPWPEPTEEQMRNRFRHPVTQIKLTTAVCSVVDHEVSVCCGDIEFLIRNHAYAEKLATLDNARFRNVLSGMAHKIDSFLEDMKREVAP